MCYFFLAATQDLSKCKKHFSGYYILPAKNNSLNSFLPAGFQSFWITSGMCACDLYSQPYDPDTEIEKIRKKYSKPKYKKRGWTTEEINQKIEAIIKKKAKINGGLSEALFQDISSFAQKNGVFFLYIKWFQGDIETENISIKQIKKINFQSGDCTNEDIRENTLFEFTNTWD